MASEIQIDLATGYTLYAIIRNTSAQVWRPASSAFEAYSAANWTNYATAATLTEQGAAGHYVGSFPSGITSEGTYYADIRIQAGGSAAVSDANCGSGAIQWDGVGEVTGATVPALPSSVQSSPTATTTQFGGGSNLSSTDNAYAGQQCEFVTGANRGVRRTITAYTGSTKVLTLESAVPVAPSASDRFVII